jgi:hypothetical protein
LVSFEPDMVPVELDGSQLRLEPGQTVIPHGPDRDLTVGDEIVKAAEAKERTTVAEINALLYSPNRAGDQLECALRIDARSSTDRNRSNSPPRATFSLPPTAAGFRSQVEDECAADQAEAEGAMYCRTRSP